MSLSPTRFADLVIAHRRRVVTIVAVVAAASGLGLTRLETDFDPETLVPGDREEEVVAADLLERFGPDADNVVVLLRSSRPLTDPHLQYLHRLSRALYEAPWTDRVDSLSLTALPHSAPIPTTLEDAEMRNSVTDLPAVTDIVASAPDLFPSGVATLAERWGDQELRTSPVGRSPSLSSEDLRLLRRLAGTPAAVGRLISRDRASAVVVATSTGGIPDVEIASRLEAKLAELPPPEGLRVTPTGLPHLRATLERELVTDQQRLVGISCLGSVLILLFGFGSWRLTALAMGSVGIALVTVVGAMGWLEIPIGLLSNMLPPLLVTIGLGDAVHFIARYREERNRAPRMDATRDALRAIAAPCLMTSLTTAVGFASLVAARTPAIREFGALASGAVLIAYIATTTFLPTAVLSTRDILPPRRERTRGSIALGLTARRAAANPWPTLAIAGLVVIASVMASQNLRTDSALLDQFDPSDEVVETTRHVEQHLGGVRQFQILLAAEEPESAWTDHRLVRRLADFEDWLEAEPLVLGVDGFTDWLAIAWGFVTRGVETPEAAWENDARVAGLVALSPATTLLRFRTADGTAARLTVRLADVPVGEINRLLDRVEREIETRFQGLDVGITGEAVRASRGLHLVVQDLLQSLGLAVVVIFAMMTLLFRDVRLGLLSVPPNLFPLAVVLGYMAMRGIPLHASTVIVLPVTFGLAVDGTIHLIFRFREERQERATEAAIDRTFRESGRAMALASFTLLFGFLALIFSSFRPVRLFAELSTVAITAALVAEVTLLPALFSLAHRSGKKGST